MNKKVALSFDTELWHESDWMKPYLPAAFGDHFKEPVQLILNQLKEREQTATFFMTRMVLERYPEMVVAISQLGHEVGCHGYKHQRLNQLNPGIFARELKNDAELIESLTGQRPKGFRAPHFSLDQKTSWLLPLLSDLGFKYDSSLFPMRTGQYGISGASLDPYRPDLGKILEFPVAVASLWGVRIPVSGGIYFRFMPRQLFKILLGRVVSRGKGAVVYFHPHELDGAVPKIQGPVIKSWLKYYGVSSSFDKFKWLSSQYQFGSIEKIFKF